MTKPIPLSADDIAAHLRDLPDWQYHLDALMTRFVFPDFLAALAFMNAVAPMAEAMNHHPEWTNVYNRVDVLLRTHEAGNQVTGRDIDLARVLTKIYQERTQT